MCVTDRHDMTLAVKVALKPDTTNQPTHQPDFLTTLKKMPFESIMGKGENADNQHFSSFPRMFSALPKTNFSFLSHYFVICKCFQFGLVSIFVELTHYHIMPHFDALQICIAVENIVRKGEIA